MSLRLAMKRSLQEVGVGQVVSSGKKKEKKKSTKRKVSTASSTSESSTDQQTTDNESSITSISPPSTTSSSSLSALPTTDHPPQYNDKFVALQQLRHIRAAQLQNKEVIQINRDQNHLNALTDIEKPDSNDVMTGRGGKTNDHPGNIKFRRIVEDSKSAYEATTSVRRRVQLPTTLSLNGEH